MYYLSIKHDMSGIRLHERRFYPNDVSFQNDMFSWYILHDDNKFGKP